MPGFPKKEKNTSRRSFTMSAAPDSGCHPPLADAWRSQPMTGLAPLARAAAVAIPAALLSLLLLTAGGAGAPSGKKYALVVGVRDYDSAKFPNLKYTENDAEELAKVLQGRAGF